jgi:hypothetical protein
MATQNLAEALRNLPRRYKDIMWWMHAICINQADEVERGHQIQRKGDVYRVPRRVVAWPGPGDEDSKLAIGCP